MMKRPQKHVSLPLLIRKVTKERNLEREPNCPTHSNITLTTLLIRKPHANLMMMKQPEPSSTT